MANIFLRWLEKRGSHRMIIRNGEDYLERYFIYRGPKFSIYLHRVWDSDDDYLHDHPWRNMSWILKGGYREHFVDGTYLDRKKGDKVFRDPRSLHRLELFEDAEPGSTWSLFLKWERVRDWGFLTPSGWVAARDYTEQPVEVYGRDFIFKGRFFPKFVKLKGRSNA